VVRDREATTSPRDRSLVERLSLLPVLIALFVGSLYTVGAVLTTGQLRHANLVVRDTLPLVPLSQILARGMSVFLKPFAGVLGIAVVFVAVVALGEEIEAWLEGWTGASRRPPRRLLRLGALLIGVLALVLLSPTDVAIGIVCCAVVLLLWVFERARLRPVLLVFAAAGAVMLLGLSFYRPEPLAEVTIRTAPGDVIHGDLITAASGTWYLGEAHRNFVAVVPSEIRSVRVDSAPPSEPPVFRRLLDVLTG